MTLREHKPEAIIFDWDNTIVDSWETFFVAFNATLREWNLPEWSLEVIKEKVHLSLRDFFPKIFQENWPEAARIYFAHYKALRFSKIKLIKDGEAFLNYLLQVKSQTKLQLFVLSNKEGNNLRAEVEHFQLSHIFDKIIGSGDCAEDKPSPIGVETLLPSTIAREKVWFIGDTVCDIECAIRAGCIPILFGEKQPTHSHFTHFKPQYYFNNYQDFLKEVQNLWPIAN